MQQHRDQADRQLGLFDPRQPVRVERIRSEEGDPLAAPVADGLFDALCSLYSRAPFLNLYSGNFTQQPDDATDLHEGAAGFAAELAERGGGALLVEDQEIPTARKPEPKRHYHGLIVSADGPAAIRELWMQHAQATEQGVRVKQLSGSAAPWTPRNFPLRADLRGVMGYCFRSAKTALISRQVLVSGSLARTWEMVQVNIQVNIQVHHGPVTGSVTGSVAGSVTGGPRERPERIRRIIDRGPRFCAECGGPIPSERKNGAMYDRDACKVAASRRRKAKNERRGAAGGAP